MIILNPITNLNLIVSASCPSLNQDLNNSGANRLKWPHYNFLLTKIAITGIFSLAIFCYYMILSQVIYKHHPVHQLWDFIFGRKHG